MIDCVMRFLTNTTPQNKAFPIRRERMNDTKQSSITSNCRVCGLYYSLSLIKTQNLSSNGQELSETEHKFHVSQGAYSPTACTHQKNYTPCHHHKSHFFFLMNKNNNKKRKIYHFIGCSLPPFRKDKSKLDKYKEDKKFRGYGIV